MKPFTTKILFISALIFLALFIASPFLHNHAADFEEHPLCLAHLVQANWQSAYFLLLLLFSFDLAPRTIAFFSPNQMIATERSYSTFVNKAPPVF